MKGKICRLIFVTAVAVCHSPCGPAKADYVTMVDNGPSSNRVDMVFLGDGYTAPDEIGVLYVSHIQAMLDHMFDPGEDPFARYEKFFNVHRIDVVSNESGADMPPDIVRDTALGARFDDSIAHLIRIDVPKAYDVLDDALEGAGFFAEMRLVTVNVTRYGGGGGAFAVYAGGSNSSAEIALHELGHSFSHLADEYSTGGAYSGPEPDEVNLTKSPDGPSGAKWERWWGYVDPDTDIGPIGAYPGGGGYSSGLYRPSDNSKMKSLDRPFDAVSREKIILDIYTYVDPLDAWLVNGETLIDPDSLWVDVVDPDVIQVQWYVNDEPVVGATGESFAPLGLGPGNYSITARAYDDTPWVRLVTDKLDQSVNWSVSVTVPEPHTLALLASGLSLLLLGRQRGRRTPRERSRAPAHAVDGLLGCPAEDPTAPPGNGS